MVVGESERTLSRNAVPSGNHGTSWKNRPSSSPIITGHLTFFSHISVFFLALVLLPYKSPPSFWTIHIFAKHAFAFPEKVLSAYRMFFGCTTLLLFRCLFQI